MKKFKIGVISLLPVLVIAIIGVLTVHTSATDRLNPLVSETVSYAKVPKNTQNYKQVTIINLKDGKTRAYKIKQVGGYDPNQKYIKIHHKGQYVKSISYIKKISFITNNKNF